MASLAMEIIGSGDDYLQLPPMEEEEYDGGELFASVLRHALRSYSLADFAPRVGVAGAPDDSELATAVTEALKTVEAPSDETQDCPICLQDDDGLAAAWKETPCGHRFHGRCVERWLQAKGSCPMCRRQVVAVPTSAATSMAPHLLLEVEHSVISEFYGQDVVDSAFIEE